MVWVAAAGGESEEGLLKDVVFYALDSRQESILWDVKPAFVVVYDPDVTFVRQLEVQPPLLQRLQSSSSCLACVVFLHHALSSPLIWLIICKMELDQQ
jgi:hypothetical protein